MEGAPAGPSFSVFAGSVFVLLISDDVEYADLHVVDHVPFAFFVSCLGICLDQSSLGADRTIPSTFFFKYPSVMSVVLFVLRPRFFRIEEEEEEEDCRVEKDVLEVVFHVFSPNPA